MTIGFKYSLRIFSCDLFALVLSITCETDEIRMEPMNMQAYITLFIIGHHQHYSGKYDYRA